MNTVEFEKLFGKHGDLQSAPIGHTFVILNAPDFFEKLPFEIETRIYSVYLKTGDDCFEHTRTEKYHINVLTGEIFY